MIIITVKADNTNTGNRERENKNLQHQFTQDITIY